MDLSFVYNSSPYWSYPSSDSDAGQRSRYTTYAKFEPTNCTFWTDYTGLPPAGEAAYARACEFLLDAKEALLKAGGWVDENTVEDLFVLTSRSCTLAVPATLTALMDPEQTMFANMFEAPALLPITDSAQIDAAWPAFEDLVYLLQVLVPGLLLLIAEDKEEGRYVTRGLPTKEWVERRQSELEAVFGVDDYMQICEAIEDGTDVHRGMLDEGREEEETTKREGWEEEFKRDWMANVSGTDSDSDDGWGEDAVDWSSSGDDDFTYANETSSNWAEYAEVWPVDEL